MYDLMPEDEFKAMVKQVNLEIMRRELNSVETSAADQLAERYPGETFTAAYVDQLAIALFDTCLKVPDFLIGMMGALDSARLSLDKGKTPTLEKLTAKLAEHIGEITPSMGAAITPEVARVATHLLLESALEDNLSSNFGSDALDKVFIALEFLDLRPDEDVLDAEVEAHKARRAAEGESDEQSNPLGELLGSIMSRMAAGPNPRRRKG